MSTHKELAGRLRAMAAEPWKHDGGCWPDPMREAADALDSLSPPDGVGLTEDWSVDATRIAAKIMSQLGIRTEPSLDPGADPRRDGVAAIVDAALAAEKARARHWENQAFGYQEVAAREIERVTAEYNRAEAAEARCDTLAGALATIRDDRFSEASNFRSIARAALATIPAKPDTETKP